MSGSFPRGEVFYKMDPDQLIAVILGKRVSLRDLHDQECASPPHVRKKRGDDFLSSCPVLKGIDRKDLKIDLSTPWIVGVKSRLSLRRTKDGWVMDLDPRLAPHRDVIQEICISVCFGTTNHKWASGHWPDDETHHAVRQDCWRTHIFGRDPKILASMLVALQNDHGKPKGLVVQKSTST